MKMNKSIWNEWNKQKNTNNKRASYVFSSSRAKAFFHVHSGYRKFSNENITFEEGKRIVKNNCIIGRNQFEITNFSEIKYYILRRVVNRMNIN